MCQWCGVKEPDFIGWLITAMNARCNALESIHFSSERVCRDCSGGQFVATVQLPFGTYEGDACATRKSAERSAALVALWHC